MDISPVGVKSSGNSEKNENRRNQKMKMEEIKKHAQHKVCLEQAGGKKGGTDAQLADYMTVGMNRLIGGSRKDMQMCVHV